MAGIARLRAGIQWPRSGHGNYGAAAGARQRGRYRPAFHGQHALCQHHPRATGAALPGKPGTGAPNQEFDSLECAGYGGARQSCRTQYWRTHLNVRLSGNFIRSWI